MEVNVSRRGCSDGGELKVQPENSQIGRTAELGVLLIFADCVYQRDPYFELTPHFFPSIFWDCSFSLSS